MVVPSTQVFEMYPLGFMSLLGHLQRHGYSVRIINGLAVLQAGPMVYGFPTRITATIGPGTTGVINIDRVFTNISRPLITARS